MHVMIFSPGAVSYGVPIDKDDDTEMYNMLYTAGTVEEGNGNGRIKKRTRPSDNTYDKKARTMDEQFSRGVRNRR